MIGLGRSSSHGGGKEESTVLDNLMNTPFLREEEITDLERFITNFPNLTERYIPVQIIGEGTFSTVYKAIDVRHYDANNESWIQWSKQDRHDALRLFAHIHKLQSPSRDEEGSPVYDRKSIINSCLLKFMTMHIELMKARNDPMVSPKQNPSVSQVRSNTRKRAKSSADESESATSPSIMPHFVALKRITPTSCPDRLADEIGFIARYGGEHNVIPLIEGIRHEDQVIAVFPFFQAPDFREILFKMTINDIADYMKLLFQSMAHIHRNFTIHRDIKPSNFMFCPRSPEGEPPKGMLVDFGLAQNTLETNVNKDIANIWRKADSRSGEYSKAMRNIRANSEECTTIFQKDVRPNMKAQRAGTRGFRAPEVLLKVFKQDFAIDVWSSGVILLTLLTRRYPFFQSMDDNDAIVEIACLFGSNPIKELAKKLGRVFNCNIASVPTEHVGWRSVVRTLSPEMQAPEECYDLLERTMCLDPKERITAEDALEHPFIVEYASTP